MFKNKLLKNILFILAIPVFGYILLNLAFIVDFLLQSLIDATVKLFTPIGINRVWNWYPPTKHLLFVFIVGLISRKIFKSKIKTVFKAIFLTLPLATIYVTIGIFLYRWPIAAFSLAAYFFLGTLYFFKRKKLHWLYYYSLILVSVVLLFFNLLGGEI